MALDFTILDSKNVPLKQVSIGLAAHQHLIKLATSLDSQLVIRMQDYYEDTNYLPSEVPLLIEEIKTIHKFANDEIIDLLTQLEQLCNEALTKGLQVSAIAD